jgi:hypothetical protein
VRAAHVPLVGDHRFDPVPEGELLGHLQDSGLLITSAVSNRRTTGSAAGDLATPAATPFREE